jgi:hypothetical protein
MSKPKNKRKRKQTKPRRHPAKKVNQKQNASSTTWNKAWKVIVGIGVIIGILVGIKALFFNDKTTEVTFDQPRFSEEVTTFDFSFGESGITSGVRKERLESGPVYPYNLGEFKPVKLYVDDGILYADVSVYGGSNLPPIRITRNKLLGKPKNWDFNSNDTAIEIVNSIGKPVYQFYYKSPSHIVVKGVFPFPSGFIVAGSKGATVIQNANLLLKDSLKPIFKYPSWKFQGKLVED